MVFLLSFISELNYLRGVYNKEKTHRILFIIEIKIKNNIRRKKKAIIHNNNDDEEKKRKKRRTKNERRKMGPLVHFLLLLRSLN